MPRQAEREGLLWARPWLDQPREAIEAYARAHRLRQRGRPQQPDPRFARGRLRRRSGRRCRRLSAGRDRAGDGRAACAVGPRAGARGGRSRRGPGLRGHGAPARLPWRCAARRAQPRNALRALAAQAWARVRPQTLVERLLAEAPAPGPARWPAPGARASAACCGCRPGAAGRAAGQGPGAGSRPRRCGRVRSPTLESRVLPDVPQRFAGPDPAPGSLHSRHDPTPPLPPWH
jgi:hypothetical protein